MQTLELRVTYKYQDAWKSEDIWKEVGGYEIVSFEKWVKETDDMTEPNLHYYWVLVYPKLGIPVEEVRQALIDSFSHVGCHHEYDCCGCRSFYASNPERLASEVDWEEWKVTVNSSRNY
jgi:hypothetical protein